MRLSEHDLGFLLTPACGLKPRICGITRGWDVMQRGNFVCGHVSLSGDSWGHLRVKKAGDSHSLDILVLAAWPELEMLRYDGTRQCVYRIKQCRY